METASHALATYRFLRESERSFDFDRPLPADCRREVDRLRAGDRRSQGEGRRAGERLLEADPRLLDDERTTCFLSGDLSFRPLLD